ncbi:MAG TPA: hypothetical protein IAA79_05250 [Candidatus Avirikenella pullistercoris]|nr:hypothetical protein [Candidatus Avirikenella pullistercoris]
MNRKISSSLHIFNRYLELKNELKDAGFLPYISRQFFYDILAGEFHISVRWARELLNKELRAHEKRD